METLRAVDVLLVSLLLFLRCICSIHDQAIPLTELSHRLLRSAILSANGGECPFLIESQSSCNEAIEDAQLIIPGDRFPLPFVKKLSVYVRSLEARNVLAYVLDRLRETGYLAHYIFQNRSLLATLGLIAMLNTVATWGVFGGSLSTQAAVQSKLTKRFREFFVERIFLITMITSKRGGSESDDLAVVCSALVTWSALVWSLESLGLFTLHRLNMVEESLSSVKVVDAFGEFKALALAFSSLVTSATMLSMAFFTLGALPFYSALLSLEAFSLFSRWLYIMSRSASRVLHGDIRSGAGVVSAISRAASHVSRACFFSFIVVALFVIHRKPLALLFVPRARFHLFRAFFIESPSSNVHRRNVPLAQ